MKDNAILSGNQRIPQNSGQHQNMVCMLQMNHTYILTIHISMRKLHLVFPMVIYAHNIYFQPCLFFATCVFDIIIIV